MKELTPLFIFLIITVVAIAASEVGKARANAMSECYKAAQVNTNIKCEVIK